MSQVLLWVMNSEIQLLSASCIKPQAYGHLIKLKQQNHSYLYCYNINRLLTSDFNMFFALVVVFFKSVDSREDDKNAFTECFQRNI